MTSYFAPSAIYTLNARELVENAYLTAGIGVPTVVDALYDTIRDEPAPYEIAVEYATAALDSTRPADELVEEAIARIQRAQALEQFREVYHRTVEQIANERIDTFRDTAVQAVTPAFNKVVKTLTTAAAKLDRDEPLSHEKAFEQDTTREHKIVTDALTTLGAYVFTPMISPGDHIPGAWKLLPIVSIPHVNVEQRRSHPGGGIPIVDKETPARDGIRKLIRDAQRDIDTALVRVARGEYEGVRFDLATPDELDARREAAIDAHRRQIVHV